MEILGYIAAVLIGLSLGLIGGGGSILSVPILVYLFQIDEVLATSYSLFIVGITSLIGAFMQYKKGLVNFKIVLNFGIPALAAILLVRKYLLPNIPYEILQVQNFTLTKNISILLLFAILMIAAAYSMIKERKETQALNEEKPQFFLLALSGLLVGVLTGAVGAGGGFLIIPALVYFAKLDMKTAIGTSLAIIAINSLLGFAGDISTFPIDWIFIVTIATLAIIGVFIGTFISNYIPGKKLKPAFGYFVLLMGTYIIIKELFLN